MLSDFAKEKVYWTRKMNLKLVKFIQARPNIWNPKHPKYTSVEYRDRTYAEFASKYGDEFTGQAVKDRWTNIRSTFAHYLRKLNATKDCAEEYKINWHLWDACQFLLSVNKKGQNEISEEDETKDLSEFQEGWVSEDDVEVTQEGKSQDVCKDIAENLVQVLQGIQNDDFDMMGLTKYGNVAQAVSKTLSQMSSFDAAKTSHKIMEILLLYDKDNTDNPNNKPMKIEY